MTAATPRPVIIAHRGASGYLPEHTLAAKVLAHAQGADYLEQDIIATADGVPIVFHDEYLDDLTDVRQRFPGRARRDGRNYCIDFSLAEIRQLELRERRDAATGEILRPGRFPVTAGSFSIPTLAEELALIRGLNASTGRRTGIYPEIKAPEWHAAQGCDLTMAVLEVLGECGYLEKDEPVYLQCFSADCLRQVRRRAGHLPLIQLLPSDEGPVPLGEIAEYANGIGPALQMLWQPASGSTRMRGAARAAGLVVHPYTFRADDLPAGFARFTDLLSVFLQQLNCDGVFTDHPDQVAAWIETQSRPQ